MRNNTISITAASLIAAALVAGCGSSSSNLSGTATGFNGIFVDSPVAGIHYKCPINISGVTDANGGFSCDDAPVTFSVGNVVLGSVDTIPDDYTFYPQDVIGVDRNDTSDAAVTEMAVFLQSLDSDGNASNGVDIAPSTVSVLNATVTEANTPITSINVTNTVETTVTIITSESNASQMKVVTAAEAVASLQETVDAPPPAPLQPITTGGEGTTQF